MTAVAGTTRAQAERRGQVLVALAAVAWSTAGVLQRQLTLDVATQIAGRAVFAGVALLLWVAVADHGRVAAAFRSVGGAGVAVAVCIAISSGTFIVALNHTSVARVLYISSVAPLMGALMARFTIGEAINRRTWMALWLALAGVALMAGAPGEGNLVGDGLALVAAASFAAMIVLTRWRHDVSMAPASCLSQVLLFLA